MVFVGWHLTNSPPFRVWKKVGILHLLFNSFPGHSNTFKMRDPNNTNPFDLYFPPFLGKQLASLSGKKDGVLNPSPGSPSQPNDLPNGRIGNPNDLWIILKNPATNCLIDWTTPGSDHVVRFTPQTRHLDIKNCLLLKVFSGYFLPRS